MIFKLLSFFTLICAWLSFQTKQGLFAALKLTFCVNYKRLLHLMSIFRSVLDSTRIIALCYALFISSGVRRNFSWGWGFQSVAYGGHLFVVGSLCDVTI